MQRIFLPATCPVVNIMVNNTGRTATMPAVLLSVLAVQAACVTINTDTIIYG